MLQNDVASVDVSKCNPAYNPAYNPQFEHEENDADNRGERPREFDVFVKAHRFRVDGVTRADRVDVRQYARRYQ